MRTRAGHIALIALAWALVALPGLRNAGSDGLTMSEGHRVVPAIEMLETGEWLVPHMFGQAYLRKPPGAIWAFAGAIRLTGDHVLGPRLVSAGAFLLMALGAWWFARRWFGPLAGLSAGLATVLTPVFWYPARSAELESLNNLFAALAAWTLIELATRRACRPNLAAAALAAFVAAGALVKGPAALPAAGGMFLGVAWAARSWRPLGSWRVWLGVGAGLAVFAGVWLAIEARVNAIGAEPVRQLPTAFLFDTGRALELAAFPFLVLLGALPLSLAMLFPWGPDARAEADAGGREERLRLETARLLTIGALAGVGVMLLAGVSNPRYAQPVVATLGPLAGWAVAGVLPGGVFAEHRRRIGEWLTLGGPRQLGVVLLAAALVYAFVIQARSRATSGEPIGRAAAGALADRLRAEADAGPAVFVADGVIEARPETLLAFRDEAARLGVPVEIRWVPDLAQITQINTSDSQTPAWSVLRWEEHARLEGWAAIYDARVHKHRALWCVRRDPEQ